MLGTITKKLHDKRIASFGGRSAAVMHGEVIQKRRSLHQFEIPPDRGSGDRRFRKGRKQICSVRFWPTVPHYLPHGGDRCAFKAATVGRPFWSSGHRWRKRLGPRHRRPWRNYLATKPIQSAAERMLLFASLLSPSGIATHAVVAVLRRYLSRCCGEGSRRMNKELT